MDITQSKSITIKSTTNDGALAKERFYTLEAEGYDTGLVIQKNVLIEDEDMKAMYLKYGFTPLKTYKGKTLFRTVFAIKVATLNEAINQLKNL